MDVTPIERIARAAGTSPLEAVRAAAPASGPGFVEVLGKALSAVDSAQQNAQAAARRFQLGDPQVSLEETMIALQTANISFQSLVQVRNRLLSAYHDIMNMQL
jgi:flagellar hook-basal body complex protein FliE